MAIFLSLASALIYGAGDFAGGMASKRARVVDVVWGSHVVGLAGVLAVSLFIADAFTWRDLGIGAISGLFGGLGVFYLYRRLAAGPMAVVAPITAVTSAVVPVIADVATGGSFKASIWMGFVLGVAAIALISLSSDGLSAPVTTRVVLESLLAGVGFGGFFIAIDLAADATAPWPIVGARLVTTILIAVGFLATRSGFKVVERSTLWLIFAAGLFDTGSNVLFLYATNAGDLAIVAVLGSLYPASTVLLARFVLDERISRIQIGGFVLALAAIVLIAAP